jgi:Spy/CpxP family protein refolding chaperone
MLLALSAHAQVGEPQEQDPRAVIEKIKVEYLIRELELTPEQAAEFSSRLGELRDIEAGFRHEQSIITGELSELLDSGGADREIKKLLEHYEDIMRERMRLYMKEMRALRQMLTPAQQARFLISRERFESEIREMIREAKQLRPGRD